MTHSLTLGALALTGSKDFPDEDHGFWFEVCAEGTEFGSPEAVTRIVTSLMSDGAIVSYDSDGNRTVPVRVRVNGPTLAAVAHGEAALRSESKRRNELTWQPPDYFAPPSVYETYPSSMSSVQDAGWDLDELRRVRTFALSLTCAPFARSEQAVLVGAMPSPGSVSTVLIDACDSAAGWSGLRNGVPTTSEGPSTVWEAGAVGIMELSSANDFPPESWTLIRTGAIDFTATHYLQVELATLTSKGGGPLSVFAFAATSTGTVALPMLVATKLADGSGYYRVVFDATAVDNANSLTFEHTSAAGYGHAWQGLSIRNVARTNATSVVSARQLSRILEVGGTERTPASLRAFTSSGFLGMTLLHTTPYDGSGYSPDMRRWRATGNTTAANTDARKITGTWEPMRPNPVISRTPAHSLPRGDYLLYAAIKSDTATDGITPLPIDYAIKSVISGQTLGAIEGTGYGWFPVAHELTIVPIAAIAAPIVRSGALDVEVHLLNPTSTVDMQVEEWWMFKDDEDSALSIVNTSEGNLWLDSPDSDSAVPTVWVGPDKPTSYHPAAGLVAPGLHTFKPGGVLTTSISDSNDYLQCELAYYERWHSNAPR